MSLIAALAVVIFVPAASGATKPTASQFDKVQSAARNALNVLGLVTQRNCDFDNVTCLNAATGQEQQLFARVATVMRQTASGLSIGKCRATLVNRAKGYDSRASNVAKAASAWRTHDYQAARRWYYAEWNPRMQLDGLFLKYC